MDEKQNIKWDTPAVETVTEKELAYDTMLYGNQRHENSIVQFVNKELAEKGVLATTLFTLFMDKDYINPYTGKHTYMNIEESYICSGVYSDKYLEEVYHVYEKEVEKQEKGVTWTDYETVYEIKDAKKNRKIRAEAVHYFNREGLGQFFHSTLIEQLGSIPIQDLLKSAMIKDALFSEDVRDKNTNRKMLIDVYGMKVVKHDQTINLRKRGGGEIIEDIASTTGGGFLRRTPIKIEGEE